MGLLEHTAIDPKQDFSFVCDSVLEISSQPIRTGLRRYGAQLGTCILQCVVWTRWSENRLHSRMGPNWEPWWQSNNFYKIIINVFYVTWYPTETIEIRLTLSSRWNEQWQPVKKVTVKKERRSQRGYQLMLVLSNLRSLDTGREKEREAKWLAGALKRKWHPSPRRRKKREEMLVIGRGSWQTDP